MSFSPTLSLIVPVYHENDLWPWLQALYASQTYPDFEVILVDGDPTGSSLPNPTAPPFQQSFQHPTRCLISPQAGRAAQMNLGAQAAQGEILLFLHADTHLPAGALQAIVVCLRCQPELAGGAFDLEIASAAPHFRLLERVSSWRSRLTRLPFGDQALFVRKTLFKQLGGFAELPLMEDLEWGQKLKRAGLPIFIFRERVQTSARRWEREGWLYTTLRNWSLQLLYFAGVPAENLKRFYPSNQPTAK
ncbi:MAG: TIGR04283 family arsenosugar biosynthesis glycosyltransferase [Candidatus Sericytochromatia bacterium]|nr:TIGR04283 family arsenosugar biosynthesis glycosyltransferase [Candidatus Sericytochromatia bacterium]